MDLSPALTSILVGIGGFIGANARYWTGVWVSARHQSGFPYGTLAVNLLGSFILGLLTAIWVSRGGGDPRLKLLIGTGFLGAFTTFSTYMVESVTLLWDGKVSMALIYVLGSVVLGMLLAFGGMWLGRQLLS